MNGGMEARPHYSDYFLACVRVSLSSLSYDGRPDRKEKKDKINKLHFLFKEGCNRTDPDNFINAVISREIFESMRSDDRHSSQHFGAWRQAPQPSSLVNIPAGIKLSYGDGFSRVQACKTRFRRNQKEHWWVVNLYDQDIGQGYLLSQIYRNSRSTANPTGVEIRNYLNLSAQVGQAEANQIELSLSTSNRKGLKAIRTRSDLDKALVALKEIPGLWVALKGGLNRTSLLGWDYENTHGLKDIYIKWLLILRDGHRFIDVDAETVDNLGGRVPGRSATDRQYIIEQMENKLLFPAETDVPTRERLKARILSIKTLIPTLKTYSWDTLHLRELGTILRLLLSPDDLKDGPRNIRSALRDIWEEPETGSAVLVEDLEDGVFSKLTVTSRTEEIFEIQLQSLLLRVMREYIKLGSFSPKTISGEAKVQPEKATITDLHHLAETARTLGFRSVQYMMTPDEALRQDCENFVKKLKPRDLWEYDMAHVVDGHCRVQHGLKTKSKVNEVQDDSEVRLSQRFGRPTTAVLDGSARYMFLRYLNSAVTETSGVTSTFVRMEFFRRFWDPVRIEVGDFSEVGMVKINSLEVESLETPSMYSDDGIADEWRLREEQENRSVREDLQTAHNQIEHLETQLARQKEQIDQYTSEMSQRHRELGELREDNEKKSAHIDNLELQAKADKDMITKLSERDENIRSAKEEVQVKRIQELEQQTSRLYDECRKEGQENRSVREDLQTAHNQITHLETQLERQKEQIDQYTSEMSQRHRELGELREDNEKKSAHIDNLEHQAKADKDMITKLSERDENIRSAKEEVQVKRIQELEQQISRLLDERRKEEQGVQAVKNQAAEKETEIEGLKNRLKEAEVLAGEENKKLREDLRSHADQLTYLQKELHTKTEQLESMQKSLPSEESRGQEQVSPLKQSAQTAVERIKQVNLEQLIEKLRREIDEANLQVKSIDEQIGLISKTISVMSKTKKNSAAEGKQFKKNFAAQNKKLTEKQNEKLEKEKSKLSSEEKLTNARYELLGLKGVEALFYERHPTSKKILSQTPTRIPLAAGGLDTEFKRLKTMADKYRILCNRGGTSCTLGFNNFQKWKSCLVDPPEADDATFYIEPCTLKRGRVGEDKLTASSKRVRI